MRPNARIPGPRRSSSAQPDEPIRTRPGVLLPEPSRWSDCATNLLVGTGTALPVPFPPHVPAPLANLSMKGGLRGVEQRRSAYRNRRVPNAWRPTGSTSAKSPSGNVTATDAHRALVEVDLFEQCQRILDARGEAHSQRAASNSDYHLTGLITCPRCGSKYVGTSAPGKLRRYRYYTCFSRTRYGTAGRGGVRIDADLLRRTARLMNVPVDTASATSRSNSTSSAPAVTNSPSSPPARWPRPAHRPCNGCATTSRLFAHGTPGQRKAVIETHVARIKIDGNRLILIFKIPTCNDTGSAETSTTPGVGQRITLWGRAETETTVRT